MADDGNTDTLEHVLDCTGPAPIEFVQTQAQNCSCEDLGTTQYLQAEVLDSLF